MPEPSIPIAQLIAEAPGLLGVESFVAAGALYGQTADMTPTNAKALIAGWLSTVASGGGGGAVPFAELVQNKDQPGGYPGLDSSKRISASEMPLTVVSGKVNWCRVTATKPTPLVASGGFAYYDIQEANLAITAQSGTDFSLGTDPNSGDGAVLSAGGGRFQATTFFQCIPPTTFDAASSVLRWLICGAQLGPSDSADPNAPVAGFGIDGYIPVNAALAPGGQLNFAVGQVSGIGYTKPGASALYGMFVELVGGIGADSVTPNLSFLLYQI